MFPPTDNVNLFPFAARSISNRPWKAAAPNCPRCDSPDTKFCYYNNYSLTQPRYFCKSCRRYWTNGGALRNVPVGGGCRKNRRTKYSPAAAAAAATSTISPPPISFRRPDPLINDASASASASVSAGGIDLEALYAKYTSQHPPDLDPVASDAATSRESNSGNCQIDAQIAQPPSDRVGGLLGQAQFEPDLDVEFISPILEEFELLDYDDWSSLEVFLS